MGTTLFEKIWDAHRVAELPTGETLLYIDRHLVHEVTSPQAFEGLRLSGRKVRRQVLATQTLRATRPKTYAIEVNGKLAPGVSAKDVILRIIRDIGAGGATGHVIEYRGSSIASTTMAERMTICNMSIEAGARAGLIAPDETTFDYITAVDRPFAPKGKRLEEMLATWRTLKTDPDAKFDSHYP